MIFFACTREMLVSQVRQVLPQVGCGALVFPLSQSVEANVQCRHPFVGLVICTELDSYLEHGLINILILL